MQSSFLVLALTFLALLALLPSSILAKPADWDEMVPAPEGCTAMIVGPKATADGVGSLTTHTADCKDCDFRLNLVPAADHAEGAMRPVYPVRLQYPRYVGYNQGLYLTPESVDRSVFDWQPTEPIGFVPQVSHTYSYVDGLYGVINEHQVAMGESTCAGRLVSKPIHMGGKAMFDVTALGRVAMERSKTAREAIQIMGDMATRYGYYGAGGWDGTTFQGKGLAGESFTVTDPNEAWVFHVLPDDTGASAVWAAQRVPDDHIAVIANAFSIGEMDLNNTDRFMASKNVYEVAERNDFWHPEDGAFHFANIYGSRIFYEIYVTRRVWRVFNLAAPSIEIDADAHLDQMPFSVKPDRLLTVRDLMEFQRDHYEGTDYDLTKGLASGPYGNPNRYDRGEAGGMNMSLLMQGTFERAISLFRTTYSFVTQSRSHLPDQVGAVVWWGPAIPHATFYSPVYPFSSSLPTGFTSSSLYAFDRSSAWWAVTAIGNYMERMYMYMAVDVKAAQKQVEEEQLASQGDVEKQVVELLKAGSVVEAKEHLTTFQNDNSAKYTKFWVSLWETLLCKYHDGYRLMNYHTQSFVSDTLFYPFEWLKAVGFFVGEPDFSVKSWTYTVDPPLSTHPKPSHESSVNVDTQAMAAAADGSTGSSDPSPNIQYAEMSTTGASIMIEEEASLMTMLLTVALTGLIVSPVAVTVGKRLAHSQRQHAYQPIEQ